jgi:AcrR family transcriptional regulator
MPKAFSEAEKEMIRHKLLEQGYKQFSAFGLKKTNIDELAAAAGISKGAFYIFYESKEALFMDVAEMAEGQFRQMMLGVVDLPGKSSRARLNAIFKQAFSLWKTVPILQFFTGADIDVLYRRVPADKLQEHLRADGLFMQELITRCQQAGIPICRGVREISGMMYAVLLAVLHEADFGPNFVGTVDVLIELLSAYCLGEIELENPGPAASLAENKQESSK